MLHSGCIKLLTQTDTVLSSCIHDGVGIRDVRLNNNRDS